MESQHSSLVNGVDETQENVPTRNNGSNNVSGEVGNGTQGNPCAPVIVRSISNTSKFAHETSASPVADNPLGILQRPEEKPFRNVCNYERFTDFENMKHEKSRLESFSPRWPVDFILPESCAKAGFFYLQDGDKVQCAFCRGVAGEWEIGDDPLNEHRKHFPKCPFVCSLPVGNVPINLEQVGANSTVSASRSPSQDVCGPYNLLTDRMPRSSSGTTHNGTRPLENSILSNENPEDYAIKTCGSGPVYNQYVTLDSRIDSFKIGWSKEMAQSPDRMAEAGFFYIGYLDHVRCFYCDGGLRNWEQGDDPWTEHARWFPNCSFVLINKGKKYVKHVTENFLPEINEETLKGMEGPSASFVGFQAISDDILEPMMDSSAVKEALDMGMEMGKVKRALIKRLRRTEKPFSSTEELLQAIFDRDPEYESDDESSEVLETQEDEQAVELLRRHRQDQDITSSYTKTCLANTKTSISNDDSRKLKQESNSASGSDDSGLSSPACRSDDEDENKKIDRLCYKESKVELQEQLRRLKEATQCKICMDNQVQVAFLPCGHLVSCKRCSTALAHCALCRQPIKAFVRTYLS